VGKEEEVRIDLLGLGHDGTRDAQEPPCLARGATQPTQLDTPTKRVMLPLLLPQEGNKPAQSHELAALSC
jgi:hypothetical protein